MGQIHSITVEYGGDKVLTNGGQRKLLHRSAPIVVSKPETASGKKGRSTI